MADSASGKTKRKGRKQENAQVEESCRGRENKVGLRWRHTSELKYQINPSGDGGTVGQPN